MNDCIFCKIIAKEIPADIIYENEHVLCFLTIGPVNEGHTLVVPKQHYQDLFDTPDDVLSHMIKAAKKTARAIMRAVDADGINLGMNNKGPAGQVVWHAHIHIIPRESNDGLKHWPHKQMTPEELKETATLIRNEINRPPPAPRPPPIQY